MQRGTGFDRRDRAVGLYVVAEAELASGRDWQRTRVAAPAALTVVSPSAWAELLGDVAGR
jgi:hypothetical protein